MRKVNYFLFACVLGFSALFVGCGGNDDDPAVVSILLDGTEWEAGKAVTGKITSDNDLKSVTLTLGGQTVAGWPLTAFGTGKAVEGSKGSYNIRIEGLAAGDYTIRATDTADKEDNKTFKVTGTVVPEPDFANATETITVASGETVYCQQAGATEYFTLEITTVSADKKSVKMKFNGAAEVELSDAGTSYLKKDGQPSNKAGIDADKTSLLFAKKSADAMLCTGNSSELGTKYPEATAVKFTKTTK
ncbi:MAG: hypothetical protein LBV41_13430 [Cytophagaceae bacterium]|jgi:hypothetical protein|nr:hypothetical protein [Cytophagaceae bacterium]